MIECKVCGAENGDLALTCRQCKSYLQAKVDTLDLFATAWGIIESPARTFKRVVLAKHKNYVVLLSVFIGVGAAATAISHQNLGPALGGFPTLIAVIAFGGGVLGLVGVPLSTLVALTLARLQGARVAFRALAAVIAYACIPVLSILIGVLPIKLAIFGVYLFDHNPSPMVIAPELFWILTGLEGIGVLWSLGLLALGLRAATGLARLRAIVMALATGCAAGALLWAIRYVRLS